jgi:hypothetical protein
MHPPQGTARWTSINTTTSSVGSSNTQEIEQALRESNVVRIRRQPPSRLIARQMYLHQEEYADASCR